MKIEMMHISEFRASGKVFHYHELLSYRQCFNKYENGMCHESWYRKADGVPHREDGPAFIIYGPDDKVFYRDFILDSKTLPFDEFVKRVGVSKEILKWL